MAPTQPSLFDPPAPIRHPTGVRRVVLPAEAELLRGYAALAAGDRSESLLTVAERCANAVLDAQGSMAVWEVRVGLGQVGELANDGTETLDGLGMLGVRMGLVAEGRERPPAWVAALLPKSHLNVNTRWRRPRSGDERVVVAGREPLA